jgi:NADPH-dependent 7-cyano-7-deazaguanine reductase QueF
MKLQYKDFHRKMAPFRDESLEQLLEEQVNQWIRLNNPKIVSVETLWERNSHVSVGVRVWYLQE